MTIGGGKYSGTAMENVDGTISLDVIFHVPANIPLVQGVAGQELPHQRKFSHKFAPLFNNGNPEIIETEVGPVHAMIHRVFDEYASAALYGFKVVPNKKLAE